MSITKIYTKKGDKGQTTLSNRLLSKDEPDIELYGKFEELNAHVGYLLTMMNRDNVEDLFTKIQKQLMAVASSIPFFKSTKNIDFSLLSDLEAHIDKLSENLTEINSIVLPGGHRAAAYCHVCRVSCRNLERELVTYHRTYSMSSRGDIGIDVTKEKERILEVIPIINRLSDYFYTMARAINAAAGIEETKHDD